MPKFIDKNPERDFANAERLGRILSIDRRHVFRLAADGVLPRQPNGDFRISEAVDRFVGYKTAHRPAAQEALDQRRADLLGRRLDREGESLIDLAEALESLDLVIGAFQRAIDKVGEEASKISSDPDRVANACAQVKARMARDFAVHRQFLATGKHMAGDEA